MEGERESGREGEKGERSDVRYVEREEGEISLGKRDAWLGKKRSGNGWSDSEGIEGMCSVDRRQEERERKGGMEGVKR